AGRGGSGEATQRAQARQGRAREAAKKGKELRGRPEARRERPAKGNRRTRGGDRQAPRDEGTGAAGSMSTAGPHVRPPDAARPRSLVAAVGAGLALGAIVIVTLLLGKAAFFGLIFAAVLIAQSELYAVLRKAGYAPA